MIRAVAALTAAVLLAGCSRVPAEPEPEGAPTERGATKQAAAAPAPPAKLGTPQKSSVPEAEVTVTAIAYKALASSIPPDRKGYRYQGVDIKTCLTKARERISVSWGPWSLEFADGTAIEPVTAWSDDWFRVPLYPGAGREVRPGRCVRGWAVFEVPAGKKPTTVVYAPTEVETAPVPLEWAVS